MKAFLAFVAIAAIIAAIIYAANTLNHPAHSSAWNFGKAESSLGDCQILAANFVMNHSLQISESADFVSGCKAGS